MNILVAETVLANPRWYPVLDVIVDILQQPESHLSFEMSQYSILLKSPWLRDAQGVRASISQILRTSVRTSGRNIANYAITLVIDESAPIAGLVAGPNEIRVRPLKAIAILTQPLHIIVEDENSDGGFILWMARLLGLDVIRRAYNAGRLTFRHAGGKRQMSKIASSLSFGVWARGDTIMNPMQLRALAILDSDSKFPGDNVNQPIFEDLAPFVAFAHVLAGRTIENYLPKKYFLDRLPQEAAATEAYFGLTENQRKHFPLKEGYKDKSSPPMPQDLVTFFADGNRQQQERDQYAGVSQANWIRFVGGFGDSLSAVYKISRYRCEPNSPHLLTQTQRQEIDYLLRRILSHL